jgi:hypothetical protein
MKLNKGTILKASCDYIRQLQKDREIMIRFAGRFSHLSYVSLSDHIFPFHEQTAAADDEAGGADQAVFPTDSGALTLMTFEESEVCLYCTFCRSWRPSWRRTGSTFRPATCPRPAPSTSHLPPGRSSKAVNPSSRSRWSCPT